MEKFFTLLNNIPNDKLRHFASGLLVFAVLSLAAKVCGFSMLEALGCTATIGLSKEYIYDNLYNRFVQPIHTVELADALATMAGGAVGFFWLISMGLV